MTPRRRTLAGMSAAAVVLVSMWFGWLDLVARLPVAHKTAASLAQCEQVASVSLVQVVWQGLGQDCGSSWFLRQLDGEISAEEARWHRRVMASADLELTTRLRAAVVLADADHSIPVAVRPLLRSAHDHPLRDIFLDRTADAPAVWRDPYWEDQSAVAVWLLRGVWPKDVDDVVMHSALGWTGESDRLLPLAVRDMGEWWLDDPLERPRQAGVSVGPAALFRARGDREDCQDLDLVCAEHVASRWRDHADAVGLVPEAAHGVSSSLNMWRVLRADAERHHDELAQSWLTRWGRWLSVLDVQTRRDVLEQWSLDRDAAPLDPMQLLRDGRASTLSLALALVMMGETVDAHVSVAIEPGALRVSWDGAVARWPLPDTDLWVGEWPADEIFSAAVAQLVRADGADAAAVSAWRAAGAGGSKTPAEAMTTEIP